MAYDKRRIEKSQYVLGVKPSTLDAPIAAQAGDFDPAPKYEYSSDGKTVTWTNRDRMPKVAAQAGDEPMDYAEQLRAAVETVCEGWTLPAGARKTLETALWSPQVSPRATADVELDAARYRWLREHGYGMPRLGAALDSSVDAAIATTKPGA